MRILFSFVETIFMIIYIIGKIGPFRFIRNYEANSPQIIWIWHRFPRSAVAYIRGGAFVQDMALIHYCCEQGITFRIKLGYRIGKITHKTIFYTPSHFLNAYENMDYSAVIINLVDELESQGNQLIPNSYNVRFFENKEFMHKEFDRLGIRSPKSFVIYSSDLQPVSLSFPYLIKEVHSAGSAGVHKVSTQEEATQLIDYLLGKGQKVFICQELLNIRKDLRVVLVDDQVVLHYWRINTGDTWRPTSTSHGSKVDFDFIPGYLKAYLVEVIQKLQIHTGGFDVAWVDDDTEREPYILEVSTSYQLNPKLPQRYDYLTYKQYKKVVFSCDAYYKRYVDITFEVKSKLLQSIYTIK